MKKVIENMKNRLTEMETAQLKEIWAPVEVLSLHRFAMDNITVGRDGEIRVYQNVGMERHDQFGRLEYYKSTDCGLSWKLYRENPDAMSRCIYFPEIDKYIKILMAKSDDAMQTELLKGKKGVWAFVSDEGPGSENFECYQVTEESGYHMSRSGVYVESTNTIVIVSQKREDFVYYPVVFTSNDLGKTWNTQILETLPTMTVEYPHKGMRWQNHCCEPSVTKLDNDVLLMIVRTSRDYHYKYYSYDGGKTWEGPTRTDFHSTLTMPLVRKLTTGEVIFLWCNTQPLPELDHTKHMPPVSEDEILGNWEDFFTNRDANHVAISYDDGKTWEGFREMALSCIRNESDFRSCGGVNECNDKSVHQFDMLELPYNKILVNYGQHKSLTRVIIFDKGWVLEKSRKEDFREGLAGVSTQVYVKSNAAGYAGFSGHCAYNRTHGAIMMPDPDMNNEEALFISRVSDPRLVSEKQGATWNFPASVNGRVKIKLRNDGCGVAISLTDRWFNPIDEYIREDAQISFDVDKTNTPSGKWVIYEIEWRGDEYTVKLDGKQTICGKLRSKAPNGLCYLHFISLAESDDYEGTYIKYMEKEEI